MRTNSTRTLRKLTSWPWLLLLGILAGCGSDSEQAAQVKTLESRIGVLETALAKTKSPASAPRLGNIMGMVQLRHGKLWFVGEQSNWPLAAYELHELEEDFEDVEKFHPIHGGARLPLGQMAVELPKPAFTVLKQAINSSDRSKFAAGFDALTASCNISRAPTSVRLERTTSWRNAQFTLKGARFGNGQNRGADFRLVAEAPEFAVGYVKLSR